MPTKLYHSCHVTLLSVEAEYDAFVLNYGCKESHRKFELSGVLPVIQKPEVFTLLPFVL